MSIFENPVIASEDEVKSFTVSDLKGFGQKFDKVWYFVAFVDKGNKRIICAMSQHKSYKKAMGNAMKNAIERISK